MKTPAIIFLFLTSSILIAQPPIQYVNTLVGTAPAATESARRHGSDTEEKGQTFPGVGRPFGMTQWTPETRTTEAKCVSPYYYTDKYITGFRGTHWMSGSCTQDYGSITIMPFTSLKPDTLRYLPASKLNHRNEIATPAYYSLALDNYQVTAEMTGSVRSGIMRFSFQGKSAGFILIRMNSDKNEGRIWVDKERNEIIGTNPVHRIYQGWGKPAGFSGWFLIRPDKPFTVTEYLKSSQQLVISVGTGQAVTLKIGSSFTGGEAARQNLEKELTTLDFNAVRKATEDTWNQVLGKITVGGGTEDDRKKFYTALYHCYQLPRIVSDVDGSYQGFAEDTLIHRAEGFDYYDDFSMWDTYRALHPLLTILEPVRTRDMIRSLILKAEQGGWMPIFPAWSSYTAAMIGDHVSTMICDSYLKGITGIDAEEAYKYMRKNAFEIPSREEYIDGKGRRALESYLKYGYIPLEDSVPEAFHKNEQVSRTLEYALDDYALAQFAKVLGKEDDYQILMKRSENWRNVFDTRTGFVRGRHSDGTWIEPFDPNEKVKFICEGTPFQYTWYVPQNVNGLAALMGGNIAFISKLDKFFDEGYYWHGNEPGQQIPFLYTMAGDPGKTMKRVFAVISEEYGTGPGGLSGNEDAGQMSAWLVFAMMGFYPVCPASNQYVISTPVFDEVKIQLPDKKYFIISGVSSNTTSKYIKAITKNGGVYPYLYITHEDIVRGSRFTLQLTDKPMPVR
ncbi:MAG: GH92 family glycosyl hydrolase [Bacteroidota bacterium]|nr:GH92 family glycosyl hydrolase [Bacteroidota bacterium]